MKLTGPPPAGRTLWFIRKTSKQIAPSGNPSQKMLQS